MDVCVYNEVFKQWLKERIPKEGKQGPREEKQIEYGWENPKEERMSFKDVEGQGRDDNSGKRKKEFKFSHWLFPFWEFLFLIFWIFWNLFLGKIRKARLSHFLNRLALYCDSKVVAQYRVLIKYLIQTVRVVGSLSPETGLLGEQKSPHSILVLPYFQYNIFNASISK